MVTAEELRKEFTDFMDEHDIRYTVMDENDNMVYLAFGGDQDTYVMVDFDEDDEDDAQSVHFSSLGFASVERSNIPAALVTLNKVNSNYRWVKFFLRDDNKLCADCDAMVFPGTVGQECFHSAGRMSNIIEHAIKEFEGVAEVDQSAMMMLSAVAAMKRMGME